MKEVKRRKSDEKQKAKEGEKERQEMKERHSRFASYLNDIIILFLGKL